MNKMNKMSKIVFTILGLPSLCFLILFAVIIFSFGHTKQYITTDISDYGKYIGNYDNESVKTFINSFFPDKIEDNFSDIVYSYRAQKNDAYAFEAYLSFTLPNMEQYNIFIESYTKGLAKSMFRYDESYWEYTVVDEFYPDPPKNDNKDIHIRYAKIGKILCCPEKQEVIFVAFGVYDGGVAKTDFLCVYFDRFHINPREYAIHTVPEYMN